MAQHDSSLNITGNIFSSLQSACADAGTDLTAVCREAGVSRSTVERWKHQEPKTVLELRKLYRVIAKKRK